MTQCFFDLLELKNTSTLGKLSKLYDLDKFVLNFENCSVFSRIWKFFRKLQFFRKHSIFFKNLVAFFEKFKLGLSRYFRKRLLGFRKKLIVFEKFGIFRKNFQIFEKTEQFSKLRTNLSKSYNLDNFPSVKVFFNFNKSK